ncbi:hypothetical protein LSH36_2529g00000 [Paralvinella palmiformis]|uniref:Uncharacterized protein n=1 Tax=Paralvinella palmiformis TaxID=53620 RepID=A0AAD9IQK5_9ANNE|nr:hypothetical protein LSH36_2529g00000 [Paralvinella palmiformis]
MASKYLLLLSVMLASFVTVYSIQCYEGASANSLNAAIIVSNCISCGSESVTVLGITSKTYTCYTEGGISCTNECCFIDLCNSGTNVTPWMIGSGLMIALRLILV